MGSLGARVSVVAAESRVHCVEGNAIWSLLVPNVGVQLVGDFGVPPRGLDLTRRHGASKGQARWQVD